MTDLEKRAAKLRAEKYGNGLDYELVRSQREAIPDNLLDEPTPMPDTFYKEQMAKYQDKFGITALTLEGKAKPKEDGQTLENASIDAERSRLQHSKLKVSTANYQGKKVKLFFEVTK
ncbi:MAG TPA: hypothetical protein VHG71_11520 [Verrucomicrobiae bacterium]|nr:hypothetical protein [Verrucomicrobiae bacterium]